MAPLLGVPMRITRLQIERFRSIKSLDFQVPQICALVGPNNAGKSNILEAIRRVLIADYGPRASTFAETDVHRRNADDDIEICLTFDPQFEFRKIQKADPVSIERLRFCWSRYQRGEKKGLRRLEQECLKPDGAVPTVQTSYGRPGQRPNFEQVIGIPQEIRDQIPFIYIGTDRSLREQLPSARWSMLRRIFEDIDHGLHAPAELVEVRSPAGVERVQRADRFKQLIREAMDLLRTGEFSEVEAAIKKHALDHLGLDGEDDAIDLFFSPMDSMEFYKSLVLIVKEGEFEVNASEMGEGMQNAIVLAILRAFEETKRKGAIILIEEPEMFLHPQMQRSLHSTLERLGETNQVIYTTHSPHFVSVPEFRSVAIARKDKDLGTTITQSDLKVDAAKLERLRQMFVSDPAELFFANRVLVVEGDTEALVAPVFAERHRIDLDSAGGTVIGVGGKRALLDYAELAISFGIATGVVYDCDKADEDSPLSS